MIESIMEGCHLRCVASTCMKRQFHIMHVFLFQIIFFHLESCRFNFLFSRSRKFFDIGAKFVPETLFLACIFGNLCVLFFYKWIYFTPEMSQEAPSLLVGLINMFMLKYNYQAEKHSNRPLYQRQDIVQDILLVICVLCIPWMLVLKPLKRLFDEKKRVSDLSRLLFLKLCKKFCFEEFLIFKLHMKCFETCM